MHPERITQKDRKLINDLNCEGIKFLVLSNDFSKIEIKNKIYFNVFCYENILPFTIYISDQKFKDSMNLFLLEDENKSHYVYIKDFKKLMFNKTKNEKKFTFPKFVYSVLAVKMFWLNIKKFV